MSLSKRRAAHWQLQKIERPVCWKCQTVLGVTVPGDHVHDYPKYKRPTVRARRLFVDQPQKRERIDEQYQHNTASSETQIMNDLKSRLEQPRGVILRKHESEREKSAAERRAVVWYKPTWVVKAPHRIGSADQRTNALPA